MDLVEFLAARLDEDEVVARAACAHHLTHGTWSYDNIESVAGGTLYDETVALASVNWDNDPVDPSIRRTVWESEADQVGAHIARHDPARVLAEVKAKRDVIASAGADYYGGPILRALAQPYADHPDFNPEWAH